MSATKLITFIGLTAKAEASYNAGGSLSTSTDGVLLDEPAVPTLSYGYDGARPNPPAIAGYQRGVAPAARTAATPFRVSAKGAAAAYSASVKPNIHALIQSAGFDAAVTITGGSEKWDYTPTPNGSPPTSLLANAYARGQLFPLTGLYSDFTITAEGPVVPSWEFATQAVAGAAITDVGVPSITYPTLTTDPPKAAGITLVLGNLVNAVVRSFTYKHGREIGPRMNQNAAGGTAGFSPGRRTPTLEVLVEAAAFVGSPFHGASTLDPYQLYEAATTLSASMVIGSVQYNRWKIIPGLVQLMGPPAEEEDGPTALWRLPFRCLPSTLNGNDDVTIRFD